MRTQRPLGNPTNKAWLAGWDAGICGLHANPYRRSPQRRAWADGRASGLRSSTDDVRRMRLRSARH